MTNNNTPKMKNSILIIMIGVLLISCNAKEPEPDPEQDLLKDMPLASKTFESRIENQIVKMGDTFIFQHSYHDDWDRGNSIVDYAPPWKIECSQMGLNITFYILQTLDKAEGIGVDTISVNLSRAEFKAADCRMLSDPIVKRLKQQLK